jgi:hypothetical protein
MKQLFIFLGLGIALTSCKGLKDISIQVERPALITIPGEIKSIGILNRSIPAPNSGLEATLTLETPEGDIALSGECLRGLKETLMQSDRFVHVGCDTTLQAADEKSLQFGNELPWPLVDSLCKAEKVDAILSLEYFDTDFSILNPGITAVNAVGQILSGNNSMVEVRGTANAAAGFRVYHPLNKVILYEDRFEYEKRWSVRSYSAVDALSKLIQRKDALYQVSYETGVDFAQNIVPLNYWEWRSYFKGTGEMKIGGLHAQVRNWGNAIVSWTSVYNSSTNSKTRGKAAYNIALGYEAMEDLENAQKWIQLAYIEYPKKVVLNYDFILENRIFEREKLENQKNLNKD